MKIILVGSSGRMGGMVASVAASEGETIVAGVDTRPVPCPFPVYTDYRINETADVLIDFSSVAGLSERLAYCVEHSLPAVLAATGYSEADELLVKETAKKIPVFKTGNFSVGINLMELLVKEAAQILGDGFDAEIIERHHNQKKDAPSGTALMLAKSVSEGFGKAETVVCGRKGFVGARSKAEIGIHAVRGGNIVGEHEVMFAGEDEIVTLSHSARSRKVFASGALKAARWLIEQPAGLYDMHDFLKDCFRK